MRLTSLLIVIACNLALVQCSPRQIAIQEIGDVMAHGIPAFEKDDDLAMVKEGLPANIKLLEVILESEPDNIQILTLLTQMYASYDFAFIEAEFDAAHGGDKAYLHDRVNRLYKRGMAYGARALAQVDAACKLDLQVSSQLDRCLNNIGREQVAALYWYGFNVAAYLNRNLNSVDALAQGPIMAKVMERVVALDEAYNFGTAHLFLMVYHGGRSQMMGGDAARADLHYQALQRLGGQEFLLGEVYRARYVLVQRDDRVAYEKALRAVLGSKPETALNPRMRLYNSLAKDRAKFYLASIEDLF